MLKTTPLAALLLCVALTSQAQLSGFSSPQSRLGSEAKYFLRGTVIDAVTGVPIPHALVQINADRQHNVFTDGEGRFQINHLPQTQTLLTVVKPGYSTKGQGDYNPRRDMVSIGPDTQPIVLKLVPLAEIRGTITDNNGEILDAVPIKLYYFRLENGVRKRQEFRQVQTDDEGQYQFSGLPAGDYILSAGPAWKDLSDPFAPGNSAPFAYAQTFAPGVPQISEAGILHIAAAQHQQTDLSLGTARTFAIAGIVTGEVPGQWSLQFINSSGQQVAFMERKTGRDSFRARVTAGHCLVKAYANDHGNHFYGQADVDVSSDLSGIRISMSQVEVPIIVQRHSADSTQSENSTPPYLRLISLDPAHPDANSQVTGTPGNWKASIPNIEFGRYRVEMDNNSNWYPESLTYGGTDLLTEPLVIAPGSTQAIEMSLRNDTASMAVKVTRPTDTASFLVTVIAVPEQNPSRATVQRLSLGRGSESSNPDVYFSLPPGRYSVYAFEDSTSLEYSNPEVLRKFSANAATVNLQGKQPTNVTLSLIRSAE